MKLGASQPKKAKLAAYVGLYCGFMLGFAALFFAVMVGKRCGVLRGTARPKQGANINLGCFYLVGMPVAVWLAFFAGFDFKGLWLGMLAAQGSCVVTMMLVLIRTDWDFEAERAKELTGAEVVVVDDIKQVEQEKPRKAESKEDSFSLLGEFV
ncbi:hypothetical protein V6N11_012955 [Hibiscus sabdariffa]|uniref:Uncharacterized protein n=2 Tax=Hibiscus sabdariffa TaxID=183260 RepID=A0ABR1ZD76_9ROSI